MISCLVYLTDLTVVSFIHLKVLTYLFIMCIIIG